MGAFHLSLKVELKINHFSGKVSLDNHFRRNLMTFNSQEIIQDLRAEFEQLLILSQVNKRARQRQTVLSEAYSKCF